MPLILRFSFAIYAQVQCPKQMKDVKLLVCTENLQSLITKLLKIRNVSVLWVSILKGEILLDMNNFNDI